MTRTDRLPGSGPGRDIAPEKPYGFQDDILCARPGCGKPRRERERGRPALYCSDECGAAVRFQRAADQMQASLPFVDDDRPVPIPLSMTELLERARARQTVPDGRRAQEQVARWLTAAQAEQCRRVYWMLARAGSEGVTTGAFVRAYITRASARCHDLRNVGHEIPRPRKVKGTKQYRFVLVR